MQSPSAQSGMGSAARPQFYITLLVLFVVGVLLRLLLVVAVVVVVCCCFPVFVVPVLDEDFVEYAHLSPDKP